ncbi:MAG: division/cell wall cluster transcriptional repressor MraZ [Dehalococcoidia bacterium]
MFLGEYEYRLDQKGRVSVPSKFREEFKEGIILTRGYDRCIMAYTPSEWEKVHEKFASMSTTRSKARLLNRIVFTNAFDGALDRQGRVMIPNPLKDYAHISDDVIIAGAGSYLEIWSKDLWSKEKVTMEQQAWQIAESVEERA